MSGSSLLGVMFGCDVGGCSGNGGGGRVACVDAAVDVALSLDCCGGC